MRMIRELRVQIDDMENEELKLLNVKHDLGTIYCQGAHSNLDTSSRKHIHRHTIPYYKSSKNIRRKFLKISFRQVSQI